ncbi:MAG: exodeoxyribonuclease V subunit gamma, partial [Pseudomonadota bacterium]
MINIYPSNRLENLVVLLDKVMQMGESANILEPEIILVQSKGMQHWLNLQLAEQRGISMNLAFSLPMQFFWSQIRLILDKNEVPEHSTYTREVLSWRIHSLLASEEIINNSLCSEATRYWLKQSSPAAQADSIADTFSDHNKRFQLACQLADLFEQYQIFRPDWLLAWEKEAPVHWQALIWKLLIKQQPLHPIALLQQAIDTLQQKKCHLPERISLFGINTLPPLWLDFLSELGEHTQVHFFHLNPCFEYWGDLKTDKANAKQHFYRWLNNPTNIDEKTSEELTNNPLLSNLGSQGKDFLFLLQDRSSIEIPVYDDLAEGSVDETKTPSLLKTIQQDILTLYDARIDPTIKIDNSLVISSAHNALREIQALHDWLLMQINRDKSLNPRDILVMCPNVENYAPYVEAVFAHGWGDYSEQIPPLPCSIADRALRDSEPLVQGFIELLKLPDSRFQASQIFSYLRLPAIQSKFGFKPDDLAQLEDWVKHAAIHWGMDQKHKQRILSTAETNEKFTWLQGLNRLLLGFAYGDQSAIYNQQLLLPDVEGEQAVLLGQFLELLEQLQFYSIQLQQSRTAKQWQEFLHLAKKNLFAELSEDKNAQQIIEQAIDALGEFTQQANYQQKIAHNIVYDFLLSHFSQPEPSRQFMAGQVTFCSMVPMRSVPFRIIAVLGLNEGEFPRQRLPMGFDLMANEPQRKGDRSRRGDDRYLFLEALISARDKLYLSYQGVDIKTNNNREPSLVLQELMNYVEQAYGWQLTSGEKQQLLKIPLQAFSKENYQQPLQSFNKNWLQLNEKGRARNNWQKIISDNKLIDSLAENKEVKLTAEDLIRFFDNPCQLFAQQQLGLYLEQQ